MHYLHVLLIMTIQALVQQQDIRLVVKWDSVRDIQQVVSATLIAMGGVTAAMMYLQLVLQVS